MSTEVTKAEWLLAASDASDPTLATSLLLLALIRSLAALAQVDHVVNAQGLPSLLPSH